MEGKNTTPVQELWERYQKNESAQDLSSALNRQLIQSHNQANKFATNFGETTSLAQEYKTLRENIRLWAETKHAWDEAFNVRDLVNLPLAQAIARLDRMKSLSPVVKAKLKQKFVELDSLSKRLQAAVKNISSSESEVAQINNRINGGDLSFQKVDNGRLLESVDQLIHSAGNFSEHPQARAAIQNYFSKPLEWRVPVQPLENSDPEKSDFVQFLAIGGGPGSSADYTLAFDTKEKKFYISDGLDKPFQTLCDWRTPAASAGHLVSGSSQYQNVPLVTMTAGDCEKMYAYDDARDAASSNIQNVNYTGDQNFTDYRLEEPRRPKNAFFEAYDRADDFVSFGTLKSLGVNEKELQKTSETSQIIAKTHLKVNQDPASDPREEEERRKTLTKYSKQLERLRDPFNPQIPLSSLQLSQFAGYKLVRNGDSYGVFQVAMVNGSVFQLSPTPLMLINANLVDPSFTIEQDRAGLLWNVGDYLDCAGLVPGRLTKTQKRQQQVTTQSFANPFDQIVFTGASAANAYAQESRMKAALMPQESILKK